MIGRQSFDRVQNSGFASLLGWLLYGRYEVIVQPECQQWIGQITQVRFQCAGNHMDVGVFGGKRYAHHIHIECRAKATQFRTGTADTQQTFLVHAFLQQTADAQLNHMGYCSICHSQMIIQ